MQLTYGNLQLTCDISFQDSAARVRQVLLPEQRRRCVGHAHLHSAGSAGERARRGGRAAGAAACSRARGKVGGGICVVEPVADFI